MNNLSSDRNSKGCLDVSSDLVMKFVIPVIIMMFMAMSLGLATANATDTKKAEVAVRELFEKLCKSKIDPCSQAGDILPFVKGHIAVANVIFAYPSCKLFLICNGYSIDVPANKKTGLCGPSGSGKSTLISLVERFYDPQSGSISLDSVNIRSINLKWLRQQISLVGQEPVLFTGTVKENIANGTERPTMKQIEEAAVAAHAHDFILQDLSLQFNTQVGSRGGRLSGGQKQRIAIARAVVRNPKILLLDEATSALDNHSEQIVLNALNQIQETSQCTTVTIAHRLTTIVNSDCIAVISKGVVAEQGTHANLMNAQGLYAELLKSQEK